MGTLHQRIGFLLTIIVIAAIGTILLISSHAATGATAFEAESGTLTGAATKVNDSAASGGKAVQFSTAPVQTTSGFVHPGILVNKADLDFVKGKIAAGAQPWTKLYNDMKGTSLASTGYTPAPVTTLDCAINTDPGCVAEGKDGQAAYTDALIWYYSGDAAYAQKSIQILNAWSSTLKSASSANNTYLYSAWAAQMFPRAAEIIRYTYTPAAGQTAFDIGSFTTMLNNVWLPKLASGTSSMASSNGNWDLSMTEGLMNIGVFTDNQTVFKQGVARWQARVPSYIYLSTDNGGNGIPVAPPGGLYNTTAKVQCFWLNSGSPSASCNTSNFKVENGQIQETCRDYNHVGLGLAGLFNAAETAHIQGVDLYGQQKARLIAGLEDNSSIMNSKVYPSAICQGATPAVKNSNIITKPTYVIGYNEFANRLGLSLPATATAVSRIEAENVYGGTPNNMMVWEAQTSCQAP